MKLADQLMTKRLVVFLGPGGVGKTTIAAAAAMEAAARGRRTLVLTVDPARRLADAMGVRLGNDPVEVRPNLSAVMLDTKAALDRLVTRYAPSPETLKRILASRFYSQLSDAFAGSEEYVAMGTLYDVLADGRYDLVVVDTPPSRHAMDFLQVNRRLIRVFESGAVKYLFKPTKFLRVGSGHVAGTLARWTSAEYLEEVADFLVMFDPMFMAMEERVRAMQDILHDRARTSLNVVTSSEPDAVPSASALYWEVTGDLALPVDTIVVNRHYPRLKGIDVTEALAPGGALHGAGVSVVAEAADATREDAARFLADAVAATALYDALARESEAGLAALRERLPAELALVPAFGSSVHDLAGLDRVRERLFAGERASR